MIAARLRAGRDADAEDFIALIGACWAEYPGCVMDVDGEVPELRALSTYIVEKGGALWAAEADGRVVGMVATYPEGAGTWAISRMYVEQSHRGTGLAQRLLDTAERHAIAAGAARLTLWSDTRFERAHRFYERRGYVRSGPTRDLHDLSDTTEFHFVRNTPPPTPSRKGRGHALGNPPSPCERGDGVESPPSPCERGDGVESPPSPCGRG